MKSLSINEFESEVIPSSNLVLMLTRLAEKGEKPVVIKEVKSEGRVMKMVGKGLLIFGSLYFLIHVVVYLVKG